MTGVIAGTLVDRYSSIDELLTEMSAEVVRLKAKNQDYQMASLRRLYVIVSMLVVVQELSELTAA